MRCLVLSLLLCFPITTSNMSFHSFSMNAIDGQSINFEKYKGKKVLIVNVASQCGYTPQYEDLQRLHQQFGDKVEILGFPANNFGSQEPGTNEDIEQFCQKNYGVTFQMFEKISVVGKDQNELYKWLEEQSGEVPNWNFCKYLLDEKGDLIGFYPSAINPLEEAITSKL